MARWLKLFLLVLGVVGFALATLPWWLGGVLRPILRSYGITFESYERTSYSRFRLANARYANASVDITAKQIEATTPVLWLLHLRGNTPLISAEDWRVDRAAHALQSSGPKRINGFPDLQRTLLRIAPKLHFWLPQIQLTSGIIHGFGPDMTIDRARWKDAILTVDGFGIVDRKLEVVLTPVSANSMTLSASSAEDEARLSLAWTGPEVKGEATWWNQPLQLSARFPAQGWLPEELNAVAKNWRVPAARVKLGEPYATVLGDAQFSWRDNAFNLSVDAKAEPAANSKTKAPPFEGNATARGNLRELTLTALHIDAPFATAKLTAPLTFSVDHSLSAESAQLVVQADLAKLPWLEARGKVEGTVNVTGDAAAARQAFELKFNDVAVRNFSIQQAQASGILKWPLMELTQLKVQLDKASSLEAHGSVNWQTHELTGVALTGKLSPTWFSRWLPAGTSWTIAEISATGEGPLAAPRHQGSLKLTEAQRPPLHPLAIESSWRGEGTKLEISAQAATEKSSLELAGTLEPHSLQLTKLQISGSDQAKWQLATPAQIVWSPLWQIDSLHLATADSRLTLKGKGGPEGFIDLVASHFDSNWLKNWVTLSGPGWKIDSLQATGHVVDRALVFDTSLSGQIEMSPRPAQVKLVAHGDARGVELKELKVVDADRVLTQATGRLPLSWVMDPQPHFSIEETKPLELSAMTEPESPLWATLSAYTGLELAQPKAKINLKGTLQQPLGELQVTAARLSAAEDRFKFRMPVFEDLALDLNFAREKITVTRGAAKLNGQALEANGELPMGDERWQQLWHKPAAFDWTDATGRLEIPEADLAAFARQIPDFPLAQGRLSARVQLSSGKKFAGELHLADAATRPLAPFGALREIQADLVLAERRVTARALTAKLAGEPVAIDGSVTFASDGAPRFALGLKGENLPLVRTTGLLLRSDLDLRADTDDSGITRLSGAVNVRDCLVLANVNLKSLLPTGLRGVTRQPPYFSVETEPLRHWPLAVDVRAQSAIRVRTTAYSGVASAHFKLGGTLGEPRAVGELTVDRGQVLFPFATFTVQQGSVRLREADPFHAAVSLNASSQRRDYQMRLEMKGDLPTPNVTITSTPALEAADVLLMVMTGQPPANETTATASGSSGPRLALLGAYLGRGLFQDLGFSGEDRLEVSSGEHVSRQGRETYEFEYKLGEHWSLLGEYDEFDSYNAGVKWRVYTQESKPLEKK